MARNVRTHPEHVGRSRQTIKISHSALKREVLQVHSSRWVGDICLFRVQPTCECDSNGCGVRTGLVSAYKLIHLVRKDTL